MQRIAESWGRVVTRPMPLNRSFTAHKCAGVRGKEVCALELLASQANHSMTTVQEFPSSGQNPSTANPGQATSQVLAVDIDGSGFLTAIVPKADAST